MVSRVVVVSLGRIVADQVRVDATEAYAVLHHVWQRIRVTRDDDGALIAVPPLDAMGITPFGDFELREAGSPGGAPGASTAPTRAGPGRSAAASALLCKSRHGGCAGELRRGSAPRVADLTTATEFPPHRHARCAVHCHRGLPTARSFCGTGRLVCAMEADHGRTGIGRAPAGDHLRSVSTRGSRERRSGAADRQPRPMRPAPPSVAYGSSDSENDDRCCRATTRLPLIDRTGLPSRRGREHRAGRSRSLRSPV